MKERYERGLELLQQVDGDGGVQVVDSLKDLAPDVGRYIIEFAFGDIYAREASPFAIASSQPSRASAPRVHASRS